MTPAATSHEPRGEIHRLVPPEHPEELLETVEPEQESHHEP